LSKIDQNTFLVNPYHAAKENAMNKEELLREIAIRKAQREFEIAKIPISWIRKSYQNKLESDEKMREFFLEIGDTLLEKYNRFPHRVFLHAMYALTGPSLFRKQFNIHGKPRDFFQSVVDYYMFGSSYGAWPIEIGEATDERVILYFDQCTVKLDDAPKLCRAVTSMEPSLSRRSWFGAKVMYTERRPEGAKRCKVVIEPK
jgi:hypothetical protein